MTPDFVVKYSQLLLPAIEGSRLERQQMLRALSRRMLTWGFLEAFGIEFHSRFVSRTASGKPFLTGLLKDYCFNISHTMDERRTAVILALARGLPVGVDVECVRPIFLSRRFQERYLHSSEQSALLGHDADQVGSVVSSLWAAKEAIGKCSGAGIQIGFSRLDLSSAIENSAHGSDLTSEGQPLVVVQSELSVEGTLHRWQADQLSWAVFAGIRGAAFQKLRNFSET